MRASQAVALLIAHCESRKNFFSIFWPGMVCAAKSVRCRWRFELLPNPPMADARRAWNSGMIWCVQPWGERGSTDGALFDGRVESPAQSPTGCGKPLSRRTISIAVFRLCLGEAARQTTGGAGGGNCCRVLEGGQSRRNLSIRYIK